MGRAESVQVLESDNEIFFMFGLGKKKKHERFYLLPGMGGRALHRKHKRILRWSIVTGLIVSAIVATILYLMNVANGRL